MKLGSIAMFYGAGIVLGNERFAMRKVGEEDAKNGYSQKGEEEAKAA
ncbi:MAG: hypothetical protein LBU47_07670 [Christensenellaceae bacterium]|nr:hypothetical protein [Christensenellaceae bacterium]